MTLVPSPVLLCTFWALNCANASSQSLLLLQVCVNCRCCLVTFARDSGAVTCSSSTQLFSSCSGPCKDGGSSSFSISCSFPFPAWGQLWLLLWGHGGSWRTEPHTTGRDVAAQGWSPMPSSLCQIILVSYIWKPGWKQLILRWYNFFIFFFPWQDRDFANKFVYPSYPNSGVIHPQTRAWAWLQLPARMHTMNCLLTSFRLAITQRNYSANSFE